MSAEPAGPDFNLPLPQPAPALPGHHAPLNPGKFPVVKSSSGAPIATAIFFEDSEIRVWENRIPGGFCLPKHTHDNDYWIVTARCDGAKMSLQSQHTDWKMSWGAPQDKSMVFIKKGATEIADNPDPNSMVLVYLCEIKTGGTPVADELASWGASSGVLYENTEVRVWDVRVPAGQFGKLSTTAGNNIFHCDVHGERQGAQSVKEMRDKKEKNQLGQLEDGFAFTKKRFGSTYVNVAGEPILDNPAGQVMNNGTTPYRGIVFEVKRGAGNLDTARL